MNCVYETGGITLVPIMEDTKQTKNVSVTVRVDEETWKLLKQINKQDRRSGVSDVARLLLERGKELWKVDGRLYDPPTAKEGGKKGAS